MSRNFALDILISALCVSVNIFFMHVFSCFLCDMLGIVVETDSGACGASQPNGRHDNSAPTSADAWHSRHPLPASSSITHIMRGNERGCVQGSEGGGGERHKGTKQKSITPLLDVATGPHQGSRTPPS